MIGAEFIIHSVQQKATMRVVDNKFPGFEELGEHFELMEEWYSLTDFSKDLHVLLVQETKGMTGIPYQRPPYPATWARKHEKGRVFYTRWAIATTSGRIRCSRTSCSARSQWTTRQRRCGRHAEHRAGHARLLDASAALRAGRGRSRQVRSAEGSSRPRFTALAVGLGMRCMVGCILYACAYPRGTSTSRRHVAEYGQHPLRREDLKPDPIEQFTLWFDAARDAKLLEPNAMSLATVSADGQPSLRTVLLKAFDHHGFVFYTNLSKSQGAGDRQNSRVSLLFPWIALERQVIVVGSAERVSMAETLAYFITRPRGSQIAAWISNQSSVITSRKMLEMEWEKMKQKYAHGEVPVPSFWAGSASSHGKSSSGKGEPAACTIASCTRSRPTEAGRSISLRRDFRVGRSLLTSRRNGHRRADRRHHRHASCVPAP